MKTIEFNITGKTETHRGNATIVANYLDGLTLANDEFSDFEGEVKSCLIGKQAGFRIYESYVDSGSNDYFYFAVQNEIEVWE